MIVRSPLDITGTEHDKTFVRPDTTVEIIDNSGNKSYKQVKDLNDEEKAAFQNRGTSATGASKSGRTANPLQFAVDDIVSQSAPQIKVNGKGTGLILSGTKAALDSDMGKELRKYLNDTFKYADLRSANISNAIDQLNQDIRDQVEQRVAGGMYGANYDDYKDYKLTMQQFQGTNPFTSTAAVPGYTRDGKKIKATDDGARTLADWLRYYQENYSAKERADLYNRSREAIAAGNKDFALWTPYLVMSGGNMSDLSSNPVYGFSAGDRVLAGVEALINEGSARLIEGINQTAFDIGSGVAEFIAAPGMTMRADDLKNRAKRILGTGGDITSKDVPWFSENAYNEKIDSIRDKSVRSLGKADKNFLAAALDSSITEDDVNNSKTVEDLLGHASYDTYISARDNLSTNEGYNKEREKIKEKGYQGRKWLQEDVDAATLYAPIETTIGSFAGTMMRMWAEAGLIKAATGGLLSPAEISDALAGKFMSMLSPTGNTLKALQTPVGSFLLSVTAEVPEDLVQTVIDDVLTGRASDVPLLAPTGDIGADMEKLGESFAQNLAFRLAFTPIHAGANSLRQWRAAKKAAKAAGVDNVISDEYFIRNQQAREAADAGNIVDVTKNSATVRNPDGTETVLDNVAMLHFGTDAELQERYPAIAEMLRKKGLVADVADSDLSARIENAKKAVSEGLYTAENGVSKVAVAPIDDPFRGYDAPETRLRAKSFSDDGNLPYVETTDTERMMLPVGKELDSYSHSYLSAYRPDYTNILGKHYDNTALAGALNILARAGDVSTITDGGSYADTLRAIYKDKMDGLAQEALAGDNGATWFVNRSIASPDESKADIKSQLQKTIDYHTKLITDLDEAENDARRGAKNIDLAKELEEAKIGLMNALGQITDEYGNLKEEVVDKIYEYSKNKGGELGDAIKYVSENGDAITSAQVDAVVAGVKEKGMPLDQGIVVEGRLIGDNLLVFSLEPYNETKFLHWSREGLKEDGNIYHIPRGTKIASTGSESEYLVDVSSGITGDGINKYVNRPNGAKYTPSTEAFDYAKYVIDLDTKGYENFGKEYLEPIGEKDKAANAFYHVVGPGNTTGNPHYNVNVTNAKLRAPENLGAMTSSRPGDILDAIIAGSEVGGRPYELYVNSADTNFNPSYQSLEESISRWITRLTRPEMEVSADPVANSVLSQQVRDWAMYSEEGRQFVSDLEGLKDWVNKRGADLNITYLKSDDKNEFLARILDLGIKYNNGSFNELPAAFQALNNYQYKAPYKAKKNFVVWRGVNDFGNGVNRNAGEMPFGSLKVGDDLVDNGYAYTSLNPYSTRVYSGKNKYYSQLGGYLIRYSVPEGSSVVYFGNPEHFGNKVHAADGGAIVLPRGSRGKVTAITKTPMGTIIDVSLADDAGNFSGLKTALNVFDENFEGAKLKGSKLEKELDRVYGDGSGTMLIGDAADALKKADGDVTVSDVRKYLSSGDNADLIYELNRRMYDSKEVTLFRGQPEAGLSRKSDVIDITDDGYHFTKDPVRAYDFDGNVVRADIDKKYIANEQVSGDEWSRLDTWVGSLTEDELKNLSGDDPIEYRLFADGKQNEAVAKSLGKPILERLDENNDLVYTYIPGVDAEFDQSMSTQMLASTERAALGTGADAANIEMANRIQQALDTEPYGKTIGEIVADKYKKSAATVDEAPNSSSYRWESPDVTKTYATEEELFADRPVGKNMTETRQWMKNAEAFYMNRYMEQTMPEFTNAYPTLDEQQQFVRNMDYLFDLQKMQGETLESAIGKTYENEGIVYTVSQEDVDFYNNYVEPMMTGLREAGAAGVGATPSTTVGYLPHSDYDPTILTAEDSMQQGVLWREYKGTSTTDDDGNFSTGWLNPDLTARYKTFVDNMLWDSLGDQVIVAKYMEEFNADGLNVAANIVEKMVGGRKRLAHLVSESDSVKAVVKNLLGDGELPTEAQLEKAAKDLGSTDIVHDLYRPVYGEAKGLYQVKSAISVKTMAKADWMRSLATGDGTLYDNGGAMIVNGAADAKFLAKRITDAIDNGEKLDVHQMFVEYLMQNQRRTAKGADYIADKWMDKIAQRATNGGISRRALTAELGNLIYGEGANRLFRFIGRMDTSQLTSANKQALDSLLFRHSALSKIKNTSGISANINKWANRLISARMKSLFWLNYKNAVLQASECVRLFTEFKFGDAKATIKKLATDADFRARVDEWVDMLVPERFVKSDSTAATGALDTVMSNSSFKDGVLTVNKLSADDLKKFGEKIDEFGRAPVELGETMKNRVMMAGILQEAERKGLTGNELFNYVNQRFERVALAANEMGRLNASDNPLFRIGANLKTFQIRQFRMFLNNIHDMNGTGEAATYIIKNLGWKAGLALIMGKLGYSTAATLGIDPFDLMDDDYTGVDEDNYTGLDYAMLSPVAKLFLSGGFTGYINDAYWAARKAYEDSATITEQTEGRVDGEFWPGVKIPGITFDNVFNAFSGFIPGFTAGKRVYQMNELMETGWATSATGNKMYQAPNNPLDVATGYAFGRSNTPNARAYYQTPDYLQGFMENGLAGIGQQLGREFGGYRQFDPIDTQNYSDWFNGTAADEQQWNSGYYYFRNKVDNAQNEYQESLKNAYEDKDKQALLQSFNQKLAEVEDQINRFTAAYEAKHPEGIDAKKMRNLTNILNLYQPVLTDTDEEREQRELDANSEALYRYSQAGLPAVTSYGRDKDTGVVEPVYSPQLRSALQGEFGLPEEAAAQIRQLYKDKWKDLGQRYRDRVFGTKGTKNKQAIQKEYISIVRQDLDPIVRLYGNNIWSNEEVENIIDDVFNSMIPKYGQSAKSYLKGVYKNYTGQLRYTEKGNETLTQINKLLDQGKTAQAKALARSLKQRVQENRTSLSREEMEKLQRVLND